MSQIFANGQRQNINLLNNRLNFSDNIYTLPKNTIKKNIFKDPDSSSRWLSHLFAVLFFCPFEKSSDKCQTA